MFTIKNSENQKPSLAFLMPGRGSKPIGGYKIVYEYANRLASNGWSVKILYPAILQFSRLSVRMKFRMIGRIFIFYFKGVKCDNWFKLNKNITQSLLFSFDKRNLPSCDYYVATGVGTAEYVNNLHIDQSRKLYLIQGFENWIFGDTYVKQSYLLGMKNIVISKWLKKIVDSVGAKSTLIPNGFDFSYFQKYIPIERKNKFSIAMLYHRDKRKGCDIGLKALLIVKAKYPQLKSVWFGTPEKPDFIPEWIEYYQRPNREEHNRIYNESAIFIAPSLEEGWGLTVGEAMICGAAIACSEAKGFKEMIEDGESGLISPLGDEFSMAENIIRLIDDDELRLRLAKKGEETIHGFSWEKSYELFEKVITEK